MTLLLDLVLLVLVPAAPQAAATVPRVDVDRVLARGTGYLITSQWLDGSWTPSDGAQYAPGETGLALYTLIKTGLAKDHPTIQAGLKFLKDRPFTHVYSVACTILAWEAIDAAAYKKQIDAAAQFLVRSQTEGGGWHYTEHGWSPGDLSNTQYALLGLRAAEHAQVRVDPEVYERAAEQVHRWQYSDGGFCYNNDPRTRPTGSMTAAGLTSLQICMDALGREPREQRKRERDPNDKQLKSWIDDGLDWLGQNFAANPNPEPYNKDPHQDRWAYYYLYGIERVGGILSQSRFGEHEWYPEGAKFLIQKQRPNGSYGDTGWNDDIANTCFAMLFLKRATARTESLRDLEPQIKADAIVRADGQNPLHVQIASFGAEVIAHCAWAPGGPASLHVQTVEYFVNKESVARLDLDPSVPLGSNRLMREIPFQDGGEKQISAALLMVLPDKTTELIASNTITVHILPQVPARVRALLAGSGEDLIKQEAYRFIGPPPANASAGFYWNPSASSFFGPGFEPNNAFDHLHVTRWLCKDDDPQPWIRLELKDPITANRVRLQRASNGPLDLDYFARPTEIWIDVNGKRIKRTLEAPEDESEVVEIPRARVTTLEIRIVARAPGRVHKGATGFQEISLELDSRPKQK